MFAVICLNLVMQPCAMALGDMDDHDCPRCPPSHSDTHTDHGAHGRHLSGHDMAASEMPCATAAADCSLLDELNYDGRMVKLEPKDTPNDCPVAIEPVISFDLLRRPEVSRGWHSGRSPPLAPATPLNVIYCVYLK